MAKRNRTARGFAIYGAYKDSRGNTVRVQESSACGGPFCWIFANNPEGASAIMHLGQPSSVTPHLTKAQARRVARALLRFADS